MQVVRIYQTGTPEVLKVEESAVPVPAPDEVLIQVMAAGVNFAEVSQRLGTYPVPLTVPAVLGSEAAGIVTAQGANVSTDMVGKRVAALVRGGYAEYAVAKADAVVSLPDAVDYGQAASALIQGQTAYLLLHDAAQFKAGQSLLVNAAAGGVGSLAVQIAKQMGASTVVGTASSDEKLSYLRQLGVNAAVDYTKPDWADQVKEATQGRGVDVVLDAVGGATTQESLSALAPFGRMVVYGASSGQGTTSVLQTLINMSHTVTGFVLYAQPLHRQREAAQAILSGIADGAIQVKASHVYALTDVAAAHLALESRQTTGKIVLQPNHAS